MKPMKSTIAATVTLLFVAGCSTFNPANSEKYLRAEPAGHYGVTAGRKLPTQVPGITLRCVESRDVSFIDGAGPSSECMYVSADISGLPLTASDKAARNSIVNYLMSLSDRNCSTFLARAFAAKTGWDTERNIAKDVLTAVASAITTGAPKTAANLGLLSLGIGSSVDNLNKNYYLEKAFHAMEDSIRAERARVKAQILQSMSRQELETYPLSAGLSDISEYDDTCSIQRGLSRLAATAEKEKKDEERAVTQAKKNSTSEQLILQNKMTNAPQQQQP